jgi:hypothetical protein
MKKVLFILLMYCCGFPIFIYGQHELPADTLNRTLNTHHQPQIKQFGEYLLDLQQLGIMPAANRAVDFSTKYFQTKDYGNIFRLSSDTPFGMGYTNDFSRIDWHYPTGYFYGSPFYAGYVGYSMSTNPDMLQGAGFKLKSGTRVNLYGKYGANGKLLPGMNAMPWQKHDFKAAFEMKSANGNFGIRVEVSRENNPMGY